MTPREQPTSSWVLRQYLFGLPGLALATTVITIASAGVEALFPWLLQQGVDVVTGSGAIASLPAIAASMLVVAVLIVAGYSATLAGMAKMFGHASYELRRMIYARLHQLPLSSLEQVRAGALAFRSTNDVINLEMHLQESANGLLFHGVVTIAAIVLMAFTSVALTLIVLAMMVVITWIGTKLGARLPAFQRGTQARSSQIAGLLQESISGAATIRAYGAEKVNLDRLDDANRKVQKMDVGGGMIRALVTPMWHFSDALSVVAVLWYGGTLVLSHQITIGALVGFLAYQQLIADPVSRFGQYYYHWQSCQALARRVASMLGPELGEFDTRQVVPDAKQTLVIDRLTVHDKFRDKARLDRVSLTVQPGERIALIGRNGSGKSTLLGALSALQNNVSGDVDLGATRLSTCDAGLWRQAFGLMAQETMLFHGTLNFNLSLAKPDATDAELHAALDAAGGARLNARLNNSAAPADISGQALSGGERKVIGLARLILRDPAIALLDEPTAHLDGVALSAALAALANFARGRTFIVATHDIEVAKLCDRMIVMDAGRIVADGPTAALIASNPLCRELLPPHREQAA